MKKKGKGRPRIMKDTVRIIIQLDASDYDKIKKAVANKKSVAQFFREAAVKHLA